MAGPGAHSVPEHMGAASFLENSLADWAQSILRWALTHGSIHNGVCAQGSQEAVPGCLQLESG